MHYMTHTPKHPDCEVCKRTMIQNTPCRRQHKNNIPSAPTEDDVAYEAFVPARFGDSLTADHIVLAKDEAADKHGDKYALVVFDKFTGILMAYPAVRKDAATPKASFQSFVAPNDEIKHIYTDNSGELQKACRELGWRHDTSTPHRPQTNGLAERMGKVVIKGTQSVLHNSGLGHEWSVSYTHLTLPTKA